MYLAPTGIRSPLGFYKPEIRVLGPGWPNCKPYVALPLLAFKSVLDRFWCVRAAHRNLRVKRKSVTLFDHIILWNCGIFNHPLSPPSPVGERVPAVFEHPSKLVLSICYPQTSDYRVVCPLRCDIFTCVPTRLVVSIHSTCFLSTL